MNIEGLSLDQMRVALAVAQAGSLSGAARRFNRTQSAVSYAVLALEKQLGIELFDRTGHRARPTPAAAVLLEEMASIISQADELRRSAKALQKGAGSEINLAVDTICSIDQITPALKSFQAEFPTISVQIHSEATNDVLKKVLKGHCCIGILSSTLHLASGLKGHPLPPVKLTAVARADHPLAGEQQPIPYRLAHQHCRIILRPRAAIGSQYTGRSWLVTDFSAMLSLIRAGLGWGYVPLHLIGSQIADGLLQQLEINDPHRQSEYPVFAVHHMTRKMEPPTQTLVGMLCQTNAASADHTSSVTL